MFASERIRIIKQILFDKKHVDVSALSTMLNVSEVTIRRDLEKLEKENVLIRTHGGAVLSDQYLEPEREDEKEQLNADLHKDPMFQEKEEISVTATHMVDPFDTILLTPGIINLLIARKLSNHKDLTVLTTDLRIAAELSVNPHIKVIVPGGDLDPRTLTLSGKMTEENISKLYVNKAFIEVDGIDIVRGYTLNSIDRASIIKEMLKITNQCIVVSTFNAFNKIAFSQIGNLNIAQKIVTNSNIPEKYKVYFFEKNIQLFTSFEYLGEK